MKLKVLGHNEVIAIHDSVLNASGGLAGLSPDKSLASALHRIYDYVTYEAVRSVHEIAALYAMAIAQGHVFNDGNKRTAMVSMVSFLLLNGVAAFSVENDEIEEMMVTIAKKEISRSELTTWIKKYSYDFNQLQQLARKNTTITVS